MKLSIKVITILLAVSALLNSCCTILKEEEIRSVYVDYLPYGSKVYAGKKFIGTTPCTVKRDIKPKYITVIAPNGNLKKFKTRKVNENYYLNFSPLGITPLLIAIDAASGDMFDWRNKAFVGDLRTKEEITQDEELRIQSNRKAKEEKKRIEEIKRQEDLRIAKAKENLPTQSVIEKIAQSNSSKIMSSTEIFAKCNPAVFIVYTSDSSKRYQGSGFIVSSSGIAISNYHVFKGTAIGNENIITTDGKEYKVEEVLACSEINDFIILKLKDYKGSFIPVTRRGFKVGDKVYAIGSPQSLSNTFSDGMISADRGNYDLQISVPIDHGSSGGALINQFGEIIGITTGGIGNSVQTLISQKILE